ncbi:tRNA pseudouridine(13) synthase TruD [Congregibacter brevis]|uniref:tRNA pseudouridine synthase D n=1 Tax=Congregibacter brevis TaxID=3081201 RepID=A0ABZ0ID01_9GAMM|nr:tRNA pseudouridine(13) synthase TruD [Congregibacter sp. IMCC45268]
MSSPELPDWPRAHGTPLFAARLRSSPQDFQVTEELGWEFSEDGEHDFLWVEKTSVNTEWVARQLALHADVPAKDIGYAGLKDRHAVTRQWFSVPRWNTPNWEALELEGVRVVEVKRHRRKLRRGAHRANSFRIVLRIDTPPDLDAIESRLATIQHHGVPNYFGEQRFGHNGGNLRLANEWASGKRLSHHKRGLAISTVRSFHFNESLAARVREESWNLLTIGDKANLAGSGSVFEVLDVDEELRQRCNSMDVHPTGVLAGEGSHIKPEKWQAALDKRRVEPGHRSLRLRVRNLKSEITETSITLSFSLDRGTFATAVLRELCSASTVLAPSLQGNSPSPKAPKESH